MEKIQNEKGGRNDTPRQDCQQQQNRNYSTTGSYAQRSLKVEKIKSKL